jgi:hypothetical protein
MLALTSPTNGRRLVDIDRSRTQAMKFVVLGRCLVEFSKSVQEVNALIILLKMVVNIAIIQFNSNPMMMMLIIIIIIIITILFK